MGSDAIARLRKAVDNQAALGESEFRLPIMDMCRLVQRASEEARGDLPVDADGATIRLDLKELYRADGTAVAVDCYMRDPADGEWWVLDTAGEMHGPSWLHARRPKPDSWERLEQDLSGAFMGITTYCKKRGLAYEIEPFDLDGLKEIDRSIAEDVVARAKRLAGAVE